MTIRQKSRPWDRLLVEASDDAEAWLNDNATIEGYAWSWNDGDFGLYELEDDDER